ncbi:MAG: SDR family NAD(P)-dependent oxidoreductase, partial [Acidobacteriota bacterium]
EIDHELPAVLYPPAADRTKAAELLQRTELAQPGLFTVSYALARLWMAAGVRPAAMLGHSLGELVAACLAGVFGLEDALRLVAARGRLMQKLPPGAMLSVPLDSADLRRRLAATGQDDIELAASNGRRASTVAGPPEALAAFAEALLRDGIATRQLAVSHAFHSSAVDPILDRWREAVAAVELRSPELPWVSNLTGNWIQPHEATDPNYWVRHLRETVRFDDGLRCVLADSRSILLEVGPGEGLSRLARSRLTDAGAAPNHVVATLAKNADRPDFDLWLIALGELWRAGAVIDWQAFWQRERRRKVELPPYPFARQRIEPPVASDPASARTGDVGGWTWLPCWRQAPPAALLPEADLPMVPWLVLGDPFGVDPLLAPSRAIRVDNAEIADVREADTLFADLESREEVPEAIVDFVDARDGGSASAPTRLILLAGAWARRFPKRPLRFDVVVTGTCRVTGNEILVPERAALLGVVRVIPQEYPWVRCRLIDVDEAEIERAQLAPALAAELTCQSTEPVVALRGGRRWVPDSQPLRLDPRRGLAWLREGGVVLITGGLGGIGRELALRLLRRRLRVAVLGRSAVPDPAAESSGAGNKRAGEGGSSEAARRWQTLQRAGEVIYLQADVGSTEEVATAIDRIRQRYGRLDGVIHAAGISPECDIADHSAATIADTLAPKVAGSRALEAALRHEPPDFLLLFSSTSSSIGGHGFAAYAAANAFLDAFAQHNAMPAATSVSAIQWGPWRDVGMLAAVGQRSRIVRQRLASGIRPDEGWQAFLRCLGAGVPEVIVSPTPWPAEVERSRFFVRRSTADVDGDSATGVDQPRGGRQPTKPPRTPLESRLALLWQDVLGVEPIGVDDNFLQLGGHSLVAVQLLARLRREEGVDLALDDFFDTLTLAELAAAIEKRTAVSGIEVPPQDEEEAIEEGEI